MPNTLKIKRGTNATIPQGQLAEPLFTTDTYDLYIGKGAGGNQRIQNYIASGTSSQFLKGDGSLDSTTYQATSEKGQNNGYASLDAGGKIPASQLPSSVMEYKGTWNASTNTPTLANGTGDAGDVYLCNVAGTVNFGAGPITFDVGDWAVYSGSIWQKSINSNAVVSVNGQTGVVVLTTTNINEGTNLYFTNSRARTAISLTTTGTSGAATYDNTTGVLNIPQYQSVLTNPITGTGTSGQVAYWSGTNTQTGSNNLFWDITNSRLGIGTTTPRVSFDIRNGALHVTPSTSDTFASGLVILQSTGVNAGAAMYIKDNTNTNFLGGFSIDSVNNVRFANYVNNAPIVFYTNSSGTGADRMRIFANGNVLIQSGGTFTDAGYRLDVNGTARVQGNTTMAGSSNSSNGLFQIFGTGGNNQQLSLSAATFNVSSGHSQSIRINTPTVNPSSGTNYYAGLDLVGSVISASGTYSGSIFGFRNAPASIAIASGSYYGIYSTALTAATNVWNLYMDGTASNYLGGDTAIGTTTLGTATKLTVGGSETASSAIARGQLLNTTLVAAANNDVLVGLDINPTFTNGAFTSVRNYAARFNGNISVGTKGQFTTYTLSNNIYLGNSNISASNQASGGDLYIAANYYYNGTIVTNIGAGYSTGIGLNPNNDGRTLFYTSGNNAQGASVTLTTSGTIFQTGNWLLGTGTTDAGFKLDVNGTARVTGAVGIGTTSPDIFSRGDAQNVGISVAGASDNMALQLNAGGSAGRGAQIYMGQGGTRHFTLSSNATESTLGTTSNTALRFTTNDAERMRITSGGNVGIGTTDPSTWIDANIGLSIYQSSDGRASLSLVGTRTTADETLGRILFTNTNTTNTNKRLAIIDGVRGSTNNSAYLTFSTADNANPVERMRITSGGNVGIGTTVTDTVSNFTTLQIDGTSGSYIRTGTSNYGGYFATIPTADVLVIANVRNPVNGVFSNTGKASSRMSLYGESGNSYITFATSTSNNTDPTERMRITSGGNIEISSGSIKTGAPSGGTAKPWKLGARLSGTVSTSTTNYLEVEVDGTLYYLAFAVPL